MSISVTRSVAIATLFGVVASSAAAQGGRHVVSVFTDAGEPVPGAAVSVGQLGLYNTMVTDAEGDTMTVERDLQAPTVVRLEEALTTAYEDNFDAMTIGQHFTYVPDDSGTADGHRLTYFQPLARYLEFDFSRQTSDLESGWRSLATPGATYNFGAYVAELKTMDVISNYFAFEIGSHVRAFQHGIIIRASEWTHLDGRGLYLNINAAGYTYGADGPQVRVYSMSRPGLQASMQAKVHSYYDSEIEVTLRGLLAPGDNLILFDDPAPGVSYRADDLGTEVGLNNPDPDCTIMFPSCSGGESCSPSAPKSYAAGSPSTCRSILRKIGSQFNVGCGSSVSESECTSYKGGVSFGGTIGNIDVTLSGEVESSECLTVSVSGGYRGQGFRCFTACVRDWEWPARTFWGRSYTAHERTSCSTPGETGTATCQTATCN